MRRASLSLRFLISLLENRNNTIFFIFILLDTSSTTFSGDTNLTIFNSDISLTTFSNNVSFTIFSDNISLTIFNSNIDNRNIEYLFMRSIVNL